MHHSERPELKTLLNLAGTLRMWDMVRNNGTRPRRTTPRESARDNAIPPNQFYGKSSGGKVDRHTQQLLSDSFSTTKPTRSQWAGVATTDWKPGDDTVKTKPWEKPSGKHNNGARGRRKKTRNSPRVTPIPSESFYGKACTPAAFRVLYNYDPDSQSPNAWPELELKMDKGEVGERLEDVDDTGYFKGRINGVVGLIPSNFVDMEGASCNSAPSSGGRPKAKARRRHPKAVAQSPPSPHNPPAQIPAGGVSVNAVLSPLSGGKIICPPPRRAQQSPQNTPQPPPVTTSASAGSTGSAFSFSALLPPTAPFSPPVSGVGGPRSFIWSSAPGSLPTEATSRAEQESGGGGRPLRSSGEPTSKPFEFAGPGHAFHAGDATRPTVLFDVT